VEQASIEPLGSVSYHGLLKARLIEDLSIGEKSFQISIQNIYNPNNFLQVNVKATLTLPEIQIERLHNNAIFFDSITYPCLPSSHTSDFSFNVVNLSSQEKKVDFLPLISPDIVDLLEITILIRSSNLVVNGPIIIPPNRGEEIKMKAGLKANVKLSSDDPRCEWIFVKSEITLGSLQVSTFKGLVDDGKQIAESIRIYGTFTEKYQYELSKNSISFRTFPTLNGEEESAMSEQVEEFVISNLSNNTVLELKLKIDLPMEISSDTVDSVVAINGLDSNMLVSIDPNSYKIFSVRLVDNKREGLSEDIRIQINDLNSIQIAPKTIKIGIYEDVASSNAASRIDSSIPMIANPSSIASDVDMIPEVSFSSDVSRLSKALMESRLSSKNPYPVVVLRGCKRLSDPGSVGLLKEGGLFLLDLGQQDIGVNSITKRLHLENSSRERVLYRIQTLEKDVPWLHFSQTNGVFEGFPASTSNDKELHVINISVIPNSRGSYSTYILLENLMNSVDFKIIKVVMDVVSSQNIRRAITESVIVSDATNHNQLHAFDVFVSGLSSEVSLIEIDDVYFDESDSAMSLVIQNNESVPLEFVLNTNLVSPDDGEIIFSVFFIFNISYLEPQLNSSDI
jgi:hypothetical protein